MRCPQIISLRYNYDSVLHRDLILGRCGKDIPALKFQNMIQGILPFEKSEISVLIIQHLSVFRNPSWGIFP